MISNDDAQNLAGMKISKQMTKAAFVCGIKHFFYREWEKIKHSL